MERREFLKSSAMAAAAMATAIISCSGKKPGDKKEKKGEMPVSRLCGDPVSLLGFGCMRFPFKKMEDGKNHVDQEAVNEMVDYALANGVNYFDTAVRYLKGECEQATANALLRHPRNSYYIATKLTSNDPKMQGLEKGKAMLANSLRIFQTDHIDYYLLHSVKGYDNLKKRFLDDGLLDYLLSKKADGTIRHLGLSFHGPRKGFDEILELHKKYHWDFIQIQMNYVDWEIDAEYMYNRLVEERIPIIIMEPLLGGRLGEMPAPVADMLKSREPDRSLASWAFRFCAEKPGILTILSGMKCMDHLKDNLNTFSRLEALTDKDRTLLKEVASAVQSSKQVKCTNCQYCMPCPYGVDIPGVFAFFNEQITNGSFVVNSEQKDYQRIRKRYLSKYSETVPSDRQADRCIDCGRCISACPQNIAIPKELRRIDLYVERLKQGKF